MTRETETMKLGKPVVMGEIAWFSADGFRRSSMSLGNVSCTENARVLASEHSMVKENPLVEGDYLAFRTFIDWTEQYAWMGRESRYQFDQEWEKIKP
jgi:hypothetical protein